MDVEAAMKRIPPHSIKAEKAVLGAMLMSRDAVMTANTRSSVPRYSRVMIFYQKAYGILFDAMVDLFKAAGPVDLITIQEYMKEKDVPPEVSSMEYVRELLADYYDFSRFVKTPRIDCERKSNHAQADPD